MYAHVIKECKFSALPEPPAARKAHRRRIWVVPTRTQWPPSRCIRLRQAAYKSELRMEANSNVVQCWGPGEFNFVFCQQHRRNVTRNIPPQSSLAPQFACSFQLWKKHARAAHTASFHEWNETEQRMEESKQQKQWNRKLIPRSCCEGAWSGVREITEIYLRCTRGYSRTS